jgi:chromosome segregation ATPase
MAEKVELSREQLIDYVKKQKVKIKKIETELATLKSAPPVSSSSSSSCGVNADDYTALQEKAKSLSQVIESYSQSDANHVEREAELTEEIKKLQIQVTTYELSSAGVVNEMANSKTEKKIMTAELKQLQDEVNLPYIYPFTYH